MTIHMITKDQVTISREMYERLMAGNHTLADLEAAGCIDWNMYNALQEQRANSPEQT